MVQHVRDEQHDADQHRNQEPQQPHPGAASRHEQNEVEHKETLHWVQTVTKRVLSGVRRRPMH
jgi:hypothetical protein